MLIYCSTLTFHIRDMIRFILIKSSALATDICIALARILICLRVTLRKIRLIIFSSMMTIKRSSAIRIYMRLKALLNKR